MELNKHLIDTNLVIAVDGSLDNEYMHDIESELRRQRLQAMGASLVSGMRNSVIKTGRGALYAYAKVYDDFNHTDTRHELFS